VSTTIDHTSGNWLRHAPTRPRWRNMRMESLTATPSRDAMFQWRMRPSKCLSHSHAPTWPWHSLHQTLLQAIAMKSAMTRTRTGRASLLEPNWQQTEKPKPPEAHACEHGAPVCRKGIQNHPGKSWDNLFLSFLISFVAVGRRRPAEVCALLFDRWRPIVCFALQSHSFSTKPPLLPERPNWCMLPRSFRGRPMSLTPSRRSNRRTLKLIRRHCTSAQTLTDKH
jgi:hypothetical protein